MPAAEDRFIRVGSPASLTGASRFSLSLRSPALSRYRGIVLYRLEHPSDSDPLHEHPAGTPAWHAMEEECPHMGAPMSEAELDIEDDGVVAICPWHNYDFNLKTGESSTGLKACIFPVQASDDAIRIGVPSGADDWELVSIRPVSDRFAGAPSLPPPEPPLASGAPETLTGWGVLVLSTSEPLLKVSLTRHAVALFRSGSLPTLGSARPPDEPPRTNQVVDPGKVGKRGKGGTAESRVKLLHALANIEQWAIDLAWDIVVRFAHVGAEAAARQAAGGDAPGPDQGGRRRPRMPLSFFADFLKVAEDEAKHFTLLREALIRLGSDWGALPTHNGLWQSARDTSHSLVSRLCIIHLVHEARGLDVNPTQIKRVRDAGDWETAASLEIIHNDEITHVAAGHRWLLHVCNAVDPPLDPVAVFRREVRAHFYGRLKPPFNTKDRSTAGLDAAYYEDLEGKPRAAPGP